MTIHYPDDGTVVPLDKPGTTILQASVASRIPHHRECGGHGRCTTCRVQILDGIGHVSERTPRERQVAEERGWDAFTRLACQTRVTGDVTVRRLVRTPADAAMRYTESLQEVPGQERNVAILMCDIRQFTPLADAHLPYDVYHILNRFFSQIGEPVLLNDGFIYQYVGDQIVGLFGLQGMSASEACLNAVRAGLGMLHALETLNDHIVDAFGVRLGIRIGIHYGPLIVGHMGHPSRRDFSVVGDAINVASRIESANDVLGTSLLTSQTVFDHLPAAMDIGFRGAIPLKGKQGRHMLIEVKGFSEPDPYFLVQQTASHLLGDPDGFATAFYRRLFETAPVARALFSGDLEAQGRMLMHTVHVAVYGAVRFDQIEPGLVALGRSHIGYGVQDEHYDLFLEVFIETVREQLGALCTPEVASAWGFIIGRVAQVMRGASHAAPDHPVPAHENAIEC